MTVTLEIFQEEGQILFAAFIKSVVAVIQLGVRIYIYVSGWWLILHVYIDRLGYTLKLKSSNSAVNQQTAAVRNLQIFESSHFTRESLNQHALSDKGSEQAVF